jgi:predicted transposase YdaD
MILEDLTMDEWMDLRYEEGREEGLERGLERVARNLLTEGSTVEFVQKITGLSTETIQGL